MFVCILFNRIYIYISYDGPIDRQFFAPRPQPPRKDTHKYTHTYLYRPPILHFMLKCSFRFNDVFVHLYQNSIQQNCLLPDYTLSLVPFFLPSLLSIQFSLMFTSLYGSISVYIYLFLGTLKRLNSVVMLCSMVHTVLNAYALYVFAAQLPWTWG